MKTPYLSFDTIVTHNGSAHLDDMLGVSVAISYANRYLVNTNPSVIRLAEVKIPLQDQHVLVLDKGAVYNIDNLNFDYHQDANLDCAFILFMDAIGLKTSLYEAFPWARSVNHNDIGGMAGVAKAFSFPGDQPTLNALGIIFSNPVAEAFLNMFSTCEIIRPGDFMHAILKTIGDYILDGCLAITERVDLLTKNVKVYTTVYGIVIADMLGLPADGTNPGNGFASFLSKNHPGVSVDLIIAHCPRNIGCIRVMRYNESYDLRKWASVHPVQFCHATGFVMTLLPGSPVPDMAELSRMCRP